MSRIPIDAGRLAGASILALAALGAAGPAANAADVALNYQCTYPLIGSQPLKVAINASIPQSSPVGQKTQPFAINAVATPGGDTASGLGLILAKSLEGTAVASPTISGAGINGLNLKVPITIAPYAIPSSGALALNATGATPAITLSQPGLANITLGALSLNLTAKDAAGVPIQLPPVGADSDGNPDTFDVSCTLDPPSQSPLLATITATTGSEAPDSQAPSVPGGVGSSSVTASSAGLSWSSSTDNVGVVAYDVYQDGQLVQTVQGASTTVGGLAAGTSYGFTVKARDAAGNLSNASGRLGVTTPASTATGTIVDYGYSLLGTSLLKTLTQGPVPVSGSIAAKINLKTQDFVADLKLNNTRAALKLVGLIPVTAQIGFVPVGQTTGSLKDGVLTAKAIETIRLPQLYLFGSIPVAGAGGCRTRVPSTINLRSIGGPFNPLKGGTLAGAYALSDLVDCGALTGIISPFAQGGGNSINVKLTPSA